MDSSRRALSRLARRTLFGNALKILVADDRASSNVDSSVAGFATFSEARFLARTGPRRLVTKARYENISMETLGGRRGSAKGGQGRDVTRSHLGSSGFSLCTYCCFRNMFWL